MNKRDCLLYHFLSCSWALTIVESSILTSLLVAGNYHPGLNLLIKHLTCLCTYRLNILIQLLVLTSDLGSVVAIYGPSFEVLSWNLFTEQMLAPKSTRILCDFEFISHVSCVISESQLICIFGQCYDYCLIFSC